MIKYSIFRDRVVLLGVIIVPLQPRETPRGKASKKSSVSYFLLQQRSAGNSLVKIGSALSEIN